tara:strand:+ start:161 stop:493 length:333 start_codon:yes stop_codon:yes gene_type:complete
MDNFKTLIETTPSMQAVLKNDFNNDLDFFEFMYITFREEMMNSWDEYKNGACVRNFLHRVKGDALVVGLNEISQLASKLLEHDPVPTDNNLWDTLLLELNKICLLANKIS